MKFFGVRKEQILLNKNHPIIIDGDRKQSKNSFKFIIFAIVSIILFTICICPIELQNDTFYTIKIGELITQNGIDMVDHFSWHEDLPYTYPHWAYDVCIYQIYNLFGFDGIYVSTVVFACILGLLIFFINKNLNKSKFVSFLITICSLFLIKDFIAARAQLVTFILFILAVFCIEKFMQGKNKKIYGGIIIIISLIIANVHVAVWPFMFILFLPTFAEQFFIKIYNLKIWNKFKKDKKKLEDKETYKFVFSKNSNIKFLLIVFILSILMGFITPLKDVSFTYLYKTMIGNTTQSINEHLPLTLIENKPIMCVMIGIIAIIMLTKIKIRFKDFCMLFGLIVLCFISRRQISLFIVIGNIYITKIIYNYFENKKVLNINNIEKFALSFFSIIILFVVIAFTSWFNIKDRLEQKYINDIDYPVEATIFIKERLVNELGDELRLFNEYNYGSYLILNDVPVFIDSRADLYAPEFNGTKNNEGKYEGRDIFSDFMDVSSMNSYYEMIFDKYDINYVLLYRATKLNIILCRDDNYTIEYIDDNYVVYKRNSSYDE